MKNRWYIHFLKRYVRNSYSREDHLLFLEWFDGLPDLEKERVLGIYHRLASSRDHEDQDGKQDGLLFLEIEKRLDLQDGNQAFGRRFLIWTRKYAAIWLLAVLVAAAGFLSYNTFFREKEMKEQQLAGRNDIPPAGNKAVLTLSDGSEIILDEAGKGKVAEQQGVLITKNEEGKLRYVQGNEGDDPDFNKALTNTITTPRGGFYQVVLPDGSTIWLNSASAIRYPAVFSDEKREIELLYGEIYIDVTPSRKPGENPFIVLTSAQRIEVYGTEFNVKSYQDEEAITTTLIRGSIKLNLNTQPSGVMLKPGQSAVVARKPGNGNTGILIETADTEKITAWKNGYFRFRNTPLYEIMNDLSRWYAIEVRYKGDYKNYSYTGYISRHVTLSNVLKIFEESGDLSFRMHNQVLEISPGANR